MKKRLLPLLLLACLFAVSCSDTLVLQPASEATRQSALVIADQYLGMSYQWGGQSYWWEEGGTVDCSGFVINVYKEACLASGASLPFSDTTSWMLHDAYTIPVTTPEPGDLIFMGTEGTVSHVALFRQFTTDNQISLIEANSDEHKVAKRTISPTYEKIISYGRMLVR